jgi:hypothetical protein
MNNELKREWYEQVGGRIYFSTAVGRGFYVLQVLPKPQPVGK